MFCLIYLNHKFPVTLQYTYNVCTLSHLLSLSNVYIKHESRTYTTPASFRLLYTRLILTNYDVTTLHYTAIQLRNNAEIMAHDRSFGERECS